MGLFTALTSALDRRFGWDKLPRSIGLLTVLGLRTRLRRENLYDTGIVKPPPSEPADLKVRTVDGSWNDVDQPSMGSVGTRFGRNVPLDRTYPEPEPALLDPSPREVSRELLTRETFIPVESVNVLAAAWLQFEVHDWFSHEQDRQANAVRDRPRRRTTPGRSGPCRSRAPSTSRRPGTAPRRRGRRPTATGGTARRSTGRTRPSQKSVRAHEDGKLRIDAHGLPPADLVTEQ